MKTKRWKWRSEGSAPSTIHLYPLPSLFIIMSCKVSVIRKKQDYATAVVIRYKVFVLGQKVPEELEVEHEDKCVHFIAKADGKAVGCGRIRLVGGKFKLERLAVLDEHRGKGYGKDIVRSMVRYTKRNNAKGFMYAQYYLLDFYKSLGFEPKGEPFDEAGIKHIRMDLA